MPSDRSADRHTTPRYPIGMSKDEWDEFGALVGDRNRSAVLRQVVRALIRRPGARMPKHSDYEPVDAEREKRRARTRKGPAGS